MEDTRTILDLARPNLFATSLDFKSAYNLFPIEGDSEANGSKNPEKFAYYHCFYVRNTWWKPRGMLFGAKHAPYYFTMIMKPVITAIRVKWRTDVVIYLDDMLILHEDAIYLRRATNEIASFLLSLGIILSVEKCEPFPKRIIKFLGWEWDFQNFALKMTPERRKTLLKETKLWKKRMKKGSWTTIKELQELVGKLQFLKPQVNRILLYLRPFYDIISKGVAKVGHQGTINMTKNGMGSLKWIIKEIKYNSPRKLTKYPPEGTLTTDASEDGYGATLLIEEEEFFMYGKFDEFDPAPDSSNQRELLAVLRAINYFREIIDKSSHLEIRQHNYSIQYTESQSRVGSASHSERTILNINRVKSNSCPPIQAGTTQRESGRPQQIRVDGRLRSEVGTSPEILDEWNIFPSIDLFATSRNHKLPIYCSAEKEDPHAAWIDAWTKPWKEWQYPYYQGVFSESNTRALQR
jgi:hypothetical protein